MQTVAWHLAVCSDFAVDTSLQMIITSCNLAITAWACFEHLIIENSFDPKCISPRVDMQELAKEAFDDFCTAASETAMHAMGVTDCPNCGAFIERLPPANQLEGFTSPS